GKSIGYAEVLSSLNSGDEDLSGLIDSIAQSTRRFAKRQLTFWRNEPRKRGWEVSPSSDEGKQIGQEVSIGGKPRKAEGFSVHSYSFNELCERVSERLQRPFSCSEVWHLDAERLFSSTFEHT
ncbi:MAG: hypothetical protein KDD55_11220, partial [Bdellovibrionales bacterium]|nr:hypothetical protein [Bdellovibrionales bacterium]